MRPKLSPAVVGAFVIGAFVLIVLALLSFGGMHFFSKPQRFVVYFDEQIHGLDLGSPLKLRGVRVGRVVDLNIRYDAAHNKSIVVVVCEFNPSSVMDDKGSGIAVSTPEDLQHLVDKGLRAQLGMLSFATGMLFVELDFMNPHEFPPQMGMPPTRFVVVPSIPSTISEFQASLTEIMADVKKADFAGLSKELKGLIVDVHKQVNTVDLKALLAQWQKTGESVNALATSPQIRETFDHVNAAVADLRGVLARLDTQIGASGQQLQGALAEASDTLAAFKSAAATLQRFVASQRNLGADTDRALSKLSDAAESVQRLADYLERNPNALITGRRRPEAQKTP